MSEKLYPGIRPSSDSLTQQLKLGLKEINIFNNSIQNCYKVLIQS